MAQSVKIKRCFVRTSVNTVVNSKLHELQYIRHNSTGPFGLAIALEMIDGRHVELATKQLKKYMALKS